MDGRAWAGAAGGAVVLLLVMGAGHDVSAQYPSMAPRDQYMIAGRSEEIALARSAAPPSVSNDADILILGAHGFETAVKGSNGFVCLVERSWDKPFGDPEFWNPKMRAPICLNPAAARTILPTYLERARWALSGLSMNEMKERAKTSARADMAPARGAMAFMMSREQYLSDKSRSWYPHLMFWQAHTKAAAWGANVPGSPVLAAEWGPVTVFFVPVWKWSDGTLADLGGHPH
jgi:hypothetical protein